MIDYDFNKFFQESKGQPVTYQGEQLILADKISAKHNEIFIVTIEEANSKYLQGIGLYNNISVFGETAKKAVVFEHFSLPPAERHSLRSKLPFAFEVICKNKQGFISIYNISLVDGRQ